MSLIMDGDRIYSENNKTSVEGIFITGTMEVAESDIVTSIADYAFANCVALKFIKIPDSVIDLGNRSFKGCKNLLCATLPENVKTIGDEAFADCENLRQVVLPASIESIGANAFANCPKLESIMVQDIERFRKMEGLKGFFHWYFQEW